MQNRNFLSWWSILVFCGILNAAPEWFTGEQNIEAFKNNYLIGIGSGKSYDSASDAAFADLIKHIQVSIEAETELVVSSYRKDDREQIEEIYKSTIKTFSSEIIKGAETLKQNQADSLFFILIGVDKEKYLMELGKELSSRLTTIKKIFSDSDDMLTKGNVFNALELRLKTEDLYAELTTRSALYTSIAGKHFYKEDFPTGPEILSETRKLLSNINLIKISGDDQSGRLGMLLTKPVVVKMDYLGIGGEIVALSNIPLKLKDELGRTIERSVTDKKGEAKFWIYAEGEKQSKVSVHLDIRRIPDVFRYDLKNAIRYFSYRVTSVTPLDFQVQIFNSDGDRNLLVEKSISESIVKTGHNVIRNAPFLLKGKIEKLSEKSSPGISSVQIMVKSALSLNLVVLKTQKTVGTLTLKASGMDITSSSNALEKSYRNLKITRKQMVKLLQEADQDVKTVNLAVSENKLQKGRELFNSDQHTEALELLTQVSEGESLIKEARKLIQTIKNEQKIESDKRTKFELAKIYADVSIAESNAIEAEAEARTAEAKLKMSALKPFFIEIDSDRLAVKETITDANNKNNALGKLVSYNVDNTGGEVLSPEDPLNSYEIELTGNWIFVGSIEVQNQKESYEGAGGFLTLWNDRTFRENESTGKWSADSTDLFANGSKIPYILKNKLLLLGYNTGGEQHMLVYQRY